MKNILLLGDSIRKNYDAYVKEKLKDIANVYYPNDNCMFTQFMLRYLHDWYRAILKEKKPDIVHFNCGLWDVLRLSNEDDTFNDLSTYLNNISRIVERILFLSPNATVIFATTTPVIEPGFTPGIAFGCRKNIDIKRFNKAIKKNLNIQKIAIDDLYKIAIKLPNSAYSDNVHFDTDVGRKALGEAVINSISPFLN